MSNLSVSPESQDGFNRFEDVKAAFARASQPAARPNPAFGRQRPAPARAQVRPGAEKLSEKYAAFFRSAEA